MTEAPGGRTTIRTFMTHGMKDADILALSTGRDEELRRIMQAIARSKMASPGVMQHVVLYGSRGFGKSFMTRRVQIEIAGTYEPDEIVYLLLPEEQHNLQRSPHAFLDMIALHLAYSKEEGDRGFEAAHFQWPKPDEQARRWDAAAARLEEAVDAALPDGKGLVVVVVENFDTLLATLFKEDADEQRLRGWLDRRKNRVMLFATATGTVDIDYGRPLFKAFEPVRLSPWTPDDCIAYFNRQRQRDGKPELDADQTAKARAIADFIGGTPRLAHLLAEVIETQDALTVAETMSALADKLAEYYRRRIDDLPPLARGLLDALIRSGEPASQTALAERVGADGQNTIARVMAELQRADIIRGRPAPDSREKLYSVVDRVFVHYYRLRQGSRAARASPLSTILDFLKSFYSRDEQRAHALNHLEAGRLAEARLFNQLARDGETGSETGYTRFFIHRLERYMDAAPDVLSLSPGAIAAMLPEGAEEVHELCRTAVCATPAAAAILSVVKAQAFHSMGQENKARDELEACLLATGEDPVARVILGDEATYYFSNIARDNSAAAKLFLNLPDVPLENLRPGLALLWLASKGWSLGVLGRHAQALETSERAANLAHESGDKRSESGIFLDRGWSLGQLGRHEEAIETFERAAKLAHEIGVKGQEAKALRQRGWSLGQLGRHEEAIETCERAAKLAQELGDKEEEAVALGQKGWSMGELARHEEAIETCERVAKLAHEIGVKGLEAKALRQRGWSMGQLGRYEEAIETCDRAAKLADEIGDKQEEAQSLRHRAWSLGQLGRHEEAWSTVMDALAIARSIGDAFELPCGLLLAVLTATHISRPEVVGLFEEWLDLCKVETETEDLANPDWALADLFIAATIARTLPALDALLEKHRDRWPHIEQPVYFIGRNGESLAHFAARRGRAEAYAAFAEMLPRIAKFMENVPSDYGDRNWLSRLISGFAGACRDPGLLRDVATLLTEDLAPQAAETAKLLTALADVDGAEDPQAALARVDPDVATLIRRLRDLPESEPAPVKRDGKRRSKPRS